MEQSPQSFSKRLRSFHDTWALASPPPCQTALTTALSFGVMKWGGGSHTADRNGINKVIINLSSRLHHGINKREKKRGGVWGRSTLKSGLHYMANNHLHPLHALEVFHQSHCRCHRPYRSRNSLLAAGSKTLRCTHIISTACWENHEVATSRSAFLSVCLSIQLSSSLPFKEHSLTWRSFQKAKIYPKPHCSGYYLYYLVPEVEATVTLSFY